MRLAQQMGAGALTHLTNGKFVPLYRLQKTSCIALCYTTALYGYYNPSCNLQANPNFHCFACITAKKQRGTSFQPK